jgi:ribosomal protein S18 acetylase RimI-like enzyme
MKRLDGFAVEGDAWLTGLVGRPAYRLVGADGSAVLPDGPIFATAKVAAEQIARVEELEDQGFRVVETTVTFTARALSVARAETPAVRAAEPGDRRAVAAIARDGFRFTRFHLDPHIPRALAGNIKATWAENFFNGRRGDAMLVAEVEGQVAGFIQLLRQRHDRLAIDLIAVDARFRGRGLARAMIGRAAGTAGVSELVVGTQAANAPSVRLYESLGFRWSTAQLVLHHHGTGAAYPE